MEYEIVPVDASETSIERPKSDQPEFWKSFLNHFYYNNKPIALPREKGDRLY